MLTRQKTILSLLNEAKRPLNSTIFVKMLFLLKQQPEIKNDSTFYSFVPYQYGPFSFDLYHELTALKANGYLSPNSNQIELCPRTRNLVDEKNSELSISTRQAIARTWMSYGEMDQESLLKDVYSRYPWYATKSVLTDLRPKKIKAPADASLAVYTAGYEGKSVDLFFNQLLRKGIRRIIDVRSNPISRRYGFSKKALSDIAPKLGLDYQNEPTLGIPSKLRGNLGNIEAIQELLDQYENQILPDHMDQMVEVGKFMEMQPSVLVCMEKEVENCHRSRLAKAISRNTGLEVIHL